MRWDIVNKLIKDHNYTSYLEIGYYKGWSFDRVECKHKLAVDPNPCKTTEQEIWAYGNQVDGVLKMTSDDFFDNLSVETKYDIIFIDGLHESEQVYRDIKAALFHLTSGGTIVLHDCNPPKYEHTTTGIDGCWTGDTYKAVLRLQRDDLFGIYNFMVLDTDWGCGILTKNNIVIENTRNINYNKALEDWNYFDAHRTELLNLKSYAEWQKS